MNLICGIELELVQGSDIYPNHEQHFGSMAIGHAVNHFHFSIFSYSAERKNEFSYGGDRFFLPPTALEMCVTPRKKIKEGLTYVDRTL